MERQRILAILLLLVGCAAPDPAAEAPDWPLSDTSYAGLRGRALGPNVAGTEVFPAHFAGRLLWVEYAAPWCPPCLVQVPAIQRVQQQMGEEVVFLTVMTSDQEVLSRATRGTARMWARMFGLDPDRVIAGDNPALTVPLHQLFSPSGQTLYTHTGVLSAEQMLDAIEQSIRRLDSWANAGSVER